MCPPPDVALLCRALPSPGSPTGGFPWVRVYGPIRLPHPHRPALRSPLRPPTRHRGKRGGLPGCSRTLVPVPMPYTPAAPTVLALADGPVVPSTAMNVSAAAMLDFSELAHIGPRTPCLRLHAPVTRDVARLGPGGVASYSPVGIRTHWVRPTRFGETWTGLPSPRRCISWSLPWRSPPAPRHSVTPGSARRTERTPAEVGRLDLVAPAWSVCDPDATAPPRTGSCGVSPRTKPPRGPAVRAAGR
jgi:hypothetical protein